MIHVDAQIGSHTKIWHEHLSNIGKCRIGNDCTIHSHVWIADGVIIGNGVKIQAFTFIPKGVVIEDGAFIGPRVTFTNDKYPPRTENDWQEIHVGRNSSLGAGVVVLPGVTIGEEVLIGAGSVVTKNIPSHCVAYGVPAMATSKLH